MSKNVPQAVIDGELIRDSGRLDIFEHRFRIYHFFSEAHTDEEAASFLKSDYGLWSSSHTRVDGAFRVESGGKGLSFATGTYSNPETKFTLSWGRAVKRIRELMADGRYLSAKDMEIYPQYLEYLHQQENLRQKRDALDAALAIPIAERRGTLAPRIVDFLNHLNEHNRYLKAKLAEHGLDGISDVTDILEIEAVLADPRQAEKLMNAMQAIGGASSGIFERNHGYHFHDELAVLYPQHYVYHLGDTVIVDGHEYEMLAFDDDTVKLYDPQFPLGNTEMPRAEFDEKLAGSTRNDHWRQFVATEASEILPVAAKLLEEFSPDGTKRCDYYLFHHPAGRDAAAGVSHDTLRLITEKADSYVICADVCYMAESEMEQYNTTFRKMPRDWHLLPAEIQEKIRAIKPEYVSKPTPVGYDLGYGFLGNGITVWNRAEEIHGDYRTVAHIETDRSVNFYDDAMPEDVRQQINAVALSQETGTFGFAPAPAEIAPSREAEAEPAYTPGDHFTQLGERYEIERADTFVSAKKVDADGVKSSGERDYAHYTQESFEEQIQKGGVVLDKPEDTPTPHRPQAGDRYEIDGRQFVVDSVNEDSGSVSLRDATFEQNKGFPIFRRESLDFLTLYDPIREEAPAPTLTPAWEQQAKPARAETFDAFPGVPMAERHNFRITDDALGHGGTKTKFRANMDAINLLRELEREGRRATPQEQETLSRYVGWGSLPQAFDPESAAWGGEYLELQAALEPEAYESARATTLNAHYTSPTVIKAIYKAVSNMGFTAGNILDPGCGVGNFQGLLPQSMADSKVYGIEIDPTTGHIAQQLYQKNSIAIGGYEDTALPDSFFDLAIGNVPFGSYSVADKRYDKHKFHIHDYFFAKTLDKVRPGGVIAFITSKYTMDKQNPSVRKYIAQRAELLGAIRLPNNAFLANAGTQVTTDIIFLQKRDRMVDVQPDWVHLAQIEDADNPGESLPVNAYFAEHPDMVLGTMARDDMMYGGASETTCKPYPDSDLADLLDRAGLEVEEMETVITELGAINNHLSFEDPYKGTASALIPELTPEYIHKNMWGSRLLTLASRSRA